VRHIITTIAAASLAIAAGSAPAGQITRISSFNPGEGGASNSIGYDRLENEVYVHFNANGSFHVYQPDGTFLRTIPKPFGGGNDDDIEVLTSPAVIGGVSVPEGTLISIENENDPPRIYAIDKSDGTVLAQQNYSGSDVGQWVGGAQASGNTFFAVDWTRDAVQQLDSNNSVIENEFTVRPSGSPGFDIFFGDIDVLQSDGIIYAVSSSQNVIRALLPGGGWGGDVEVGALGVGGMAGIAFDDTTGEAWIGSQNGTVYRLGGFPPPGCVIADLAPPLGVLDLADVGGFANAFIAGDPVADLAEPFGQLDLSDVSAFIVAFLAGCPD